jgi:hypothetical protein
MAILGSRKSTGYLTFAQCPLKDIFTKLALKGLLIKIMYNRLKVSFLGSKHFCIVYTVQEHYSLFLNFLYSSLCIIVRVCASRILSPFLSSFYVTKLGLSNGFHQHAILINGTVPLKTLRLKRGLLFGHYCLCHKGKPNTVITYLHRVPHAPYLCIAIYTQRVRYFRTYVRHT